ncbi:L,D-transpeptidase family protein [Bdellovibrio sp. HCB2-146]|uniref:L,D-transpeptidase family protein n=1 Tax=Bdellovibrio sp. HCB2-146 TaxID=3394362 RepID=UPI0039BC4CB7
MNALFGLSLFLLLLFSHVLASAQNGQNGRDHAEYLEMMNEFPLQEIRRTIGTIAAHGLQPNVYWTAAMEKSYLVDPGDTNTSLRTKANENFLRLLRDISIGGTDPQKLGLDIRIPQKPFIPVKDLGMLIVTTGGKGDLILEALAPQNVWYASLQESLKYLMPLCQNGSWTSLAPVKKELKLGSKNKQIPELKSRLALYGYRFANMDETFDQDLLYAVSDVQSILRVKPDGKISPGGRTWRYLNVPCALRVRQVQADMEKIRWFPPTFEDRYIFVNLAFSQFLLVDKTAGGSNQSMNFRTINGRVQRKTPMMKDRMDYVIFNPFWVVPPTIFIEDKVEEIKQLNYWQINAYFNSHNYEVWNRSFTRRLDPASINWWAIDPSADFDIYIRQRPHTGNALGVVKFMLTNSFSIYLHDTNQRELFAQPNRLLSSGCVRLERPLDLAEYVLQGTEWNRTAIENIVAKPGEVLNKDTKVNLTNKIPVYLVNMTSQLNSDRVLRFAEDPYSQNTRINMYLKSLL